MCVQAVFSHKSYIVVPSDSSEEDIGRLDVLCRILGVGLILFNPDDAANLGFQIRVRAARHERDMSYVNRYMKLLEDAGAKVIMLEKGLEGRGTST